MESPSSPEDIAPEALSIRLWMFRLKNPVVDGAAHMLQEGAEEPGVGLGNAEIPADYEAKISLIHTDSYPLIPDITTPLIKNFWRKA
jgi:hypothetical protein